MRVHTVIALAALSLASGASLEESGRSISDWLWPLAVESYPEVQPAESVPGRAAVEPIELEEEGRRRRDRSEGNKKTGDKNVQVSVNISKNKNRVRDKGSNAKPGGAGGGHNTPIKPLAGAPIVVGGGGVGGGNNYYTNPVAVSVNEGDSGWGWGWIKGMMNGPSWSGLGGSLGGIPGSAGILGSSLGSLPGSAGLLGGSPGSDYNPGSGGPSGSVVSGGSYIPGFGGFGNGGLGSGGGGGGGYKPGYGGSGSGGGGGPGNDGIVSVTYGKPPADHYDTHGPGIFNPFAGWLYPSSSAVSGPNQGGGNGPGGPGPSSNSPSTSEVMVIRYPEFIKTIGQGISKMTNAMKDLGEGVSQTLTKGMSGPSAVIGNGVASIIALEEVGNVHHQPGGLNNQPIYPGGSAVGSPSQGSPGSAVYVDKHPTGSGGLGSWFPNPGSWFGSYPFKGSGPGSGFGVLGSGLGSGSGGSGFGVLGSGLGSGSGGSGSGQGSGSTSTVYADKPKGGHHG